jgi:FtsZ-interacting cell division protein ZipA
MRIGSSQGTLPTAHGETLSGIDIFGIIVVVGFFAFVALVVYISNEWEKEKKRKALEKKKMKMEQARKKGEQRALNDIMARTPEVFNRDLRQALNHYRVNRAVELVRALPAPANQQAVDVIYAVNELKKAVASATDSEELKKLMGPMRDAAKDLEEDLCETSSLIVKIIRGHRTLDYKQLPDAALSELNSHSAKLEKMLDRATKARTYVKETTATMSLHGESVERSAWIESYPPISDPGPGHYLES